MGINQDLEKYLYLTCSIYPEFTERHFGLVCRILRGRKSCKARITSLDTKTQEDSRLLVVKAEIEANYLQLAMNSGTSLLKPVSQQVKKCSMFKYVTKKNHSKGGRT